MGEEANKAAAIRAQAEAQAAVAAMAKQGKKGVSSQDRKRAAPEQATLGAANQDFRSWLMELDRGEGSLLRYYEKLNELFDDLGELDLVAEGPRGEVPDPQFFEDLEVRSERHRDLFVRWFRARRGMRSSPHREEKEQRSS